MAEEIVLTREERARLRSEYDLLVVRLNETQEPSVREGIRQRLLELQMLAEKAKSAPEEPVPSSVTASHEPEPQAQPVEEVVHFEPTPEQVVEVPVGNELPSKVAGLIDEYNSIQAKLSTSNEKLVQEAFAEKLQDVIKRIEDEGYHPNGTLNGKGPKRKVEEDVPLPQVDTALILKAEDLIRQYRLAKQRGQALAATDLLSQANAVTAYSAQVQEAMGDEYAAKNEWTKAKEAYHLAHRLNPRDVGIERKYAEIVLRSNRNFDIENALRSGSIDALLLSQNDQVARPGMAALLSFCLPGLGQFVLGKNVLGGTLLGTWLVSFVFLFLHFRTSKGHVDALTIGAGIVVILTIIVGVGDCLSAGKKKNKLEF